MQSSQRHPEYQYLDLLEDILANGTQKSDHNTGKGLTSVFGRQIRFDLSQGFPMLTTKKVYWRGVLHELVWFMTGQTNIKYLVDNKVHIWDDYPYKDYKKLVAAGKAGEMTQEEFIGQIKNDAEFAKQYGELPHIYGGQWRSWPRTNGDTIDQLAWVLDTVKNFPQRKHAVVSVWNPEHLYGMALPGEALSFPLCHIFFHFNVNDGKLSCQLYQRSADMFLGVPFNIASYAMLTQVIAHLAGLEPGEFIHTFGDAHIYDNHRDAVAEQLEREPKPFPTLVIDPALKSLDDVSADMFTLEDYDAHPPIKAELTVAGGFQEKDRTAATKLGA